ncbi:MAG: hypothetical protein ACI9G1_003900 [Pirellulaceae bacterium]|jgi:hypothetical protein
MVTNNCRIDSGYAERPNVEMRRHLPGFGNRLGCCCLCGKIIPLRVSGCCLKNAKKLWSTFRG